MRYLATNFVSLSLMTLVACGTDGDSPPAQKAVKSTNGAATESARPLGTGANSTTPWKAPAQVRSGALTPFLAVQGLARESALRVPLLAETHFDLAITGVKSFGDANVGRFVVRLPDLSQESIRLDADGTPAYTFKSAGAALVAFCAGPKGPKRPDAWQHVNRCTKLVLSATERVDDRVRGNAGITTKTGDPIEIRPLLSPLGLTPGSDLPVRIYHLGMSQVGAKVVAHRPDGSVDEQVTVGGGMAHFHVNQAGRWILRYTKPTSDGGKIAELVFDIYESSRLLRPAVLDTLHNRALGPTTVATARRPHATWESFGPAPIDSNNWTGRITAVVPHPTEDIVYVGAASGGVWKRQGTTWTPLTDNMPNMLTGWVTMDPSNPNTLYVGTGDSRMCSSCYYGDGIYKTTDGGTTWEVLGRDTFAGRTFSRIIVSPNDPNLLYASVMRAGGVDAVASKKHPGMTGPLGLFKSIDAGLTWTQLTGGIPNGPASGLAIDWKNPTTVYGALGDPWDGAQNGIFKSTDGGATFTKLAGGLPTLGRTVIEVAPSDSNRVYALVVNPGGPNRDQATTNGLWVSTDAGSSWSQKNPGSIHSSQGWYNNAIAVHPTDPDTVVLGGLNMVITTDGGDSFDDITPPHVDQHAYAFAPNGDLYAGDDGGVQKSTSQGSSWSSITDGLGVVQIYAGTSLHPTDESFVLAGMQDNGSNLRRNGEWTDVFGADGGYTGLHPDQPDTMFIEWQESGNLYRSTNGGSSFSKVGNGIDTTDRVPFLPAYEISPADPNTVLYATHRVYKSTNQGTSFSAISDDVTEGGKNRIRAIQIAKSNANVVYVATSDGRIRVSTDGGATFTTKLEGLHINYLVTRELEISPDDDKVALVAVPAFDTDQIRYTTDQGATWTALDGDFPNLPANTVDLSKIDGTEVIFLGTDNGVYFTCNHGTNWGKLGQGLPNVVVMDVRHDPNFSRVVATTFGRGMWVVDQPTLTECPMGTGGTGGMGGAGGSGGAGAGGAGAGGSGGTAGTGGAGAGGTGGGPGGTGGASGGTAGTGGTGTGGTSGTGATGGSTGGTGQAGVGGTGATSGTESGDDGGCGCRVAGQPANLPSAAALLLVAGALARRRRSAASR